MCYYLNAQCLHLVVVAIAVIKDFGLSVLML